MSSAQDTNRRDVMKTIAATSMTFAFSATVSKKAGAYANRKLAAFRAVTKGPKFHWRGYYDKLLFDHSDQYILCNEVDFEHRTPEPNDEIRVGMVDLQDNDRWIDLGGTHAWNWQQGCMLQWLPGARREVIWNDRKEDKFVAYIVDVDTGKKREIPMPIYCVSPDASWGLSVDFRRLNDCRPGYGYAGINDPYGDSAAPKKTGIWKVDLRSGESELLLNYAQIAAMNYASDVQYQFDPKKSKHWFNHLLVAPGGKRFLFLHRWRETPPNATREDIAKTSFSTRMWTCNADGTDPYVVDPYGKTSHFVWRDESSICAWAWHPSHRDRFYLYQDQSSVVDVVGLDAMTENGHNTYLPHRNNDWILNDTYPDKGRLQHPYLYQISTNERFELGQFVSPERYMREWRCDLHPCASSSGKLISIDSPHEGNGRQVYIIDASEILES